MYKKALPVFFFWGENYSFDSTEISDSNYTSDMDDRGDIIHKMFDKGDSTQCFRPDKLANLDKF